MSTNDTDIDINNIFEEDEINMVEDDDDEIIHLQQSVFYIIFYYITLLYVTLCPKFLMKFIEYLFLLSAVISFIILINMHINFVQMPVTCLDHIKDTWPRNGILRIEIQTRKQIFAEQASTLDDWFTLEKSYEHEYKQEQLITNRTISTTLKNFFMKTNIIKEAFQIFEKYLKDITNNIFSSPTSESIRNKNFSQTEWPVQIDSIKNLNSTIKGISGIENNSLMTLSNKYNEGILHTHFIVEFTMHFEYFFLSPKTKTLKNIPVMLVILEPSRQKCFGNSLNQFVLNNILGYDDFILSCLKTMIGNIQNQGYLRNVFEEKYYILYTSNNKNSKIIHCINAIISMIVLTMIILIIVKFVFNVMFNFMVGIQDMVDLQSIICFSFRPIILAIITALGMLKFLNATFRDITKDITWYIILIVCAADRFDVFCNHIQTKKHWVKFFILYQYSFYAYLHMFNGQYCYLALICSCIFTLHSMIYFYHRYEIQYILQDEDEHEMEN